MIAILTMTVTTARGESLPAKGDITGKPRPKAYIVSIGVGSQANLKQDLEFPPADARGYFEALPKFIATSGQFATVDIIPTLLTNNGSWDSRKNQWQNVSESNSKRNIILGVLDLLAGKQVSPEIRRQIPGVDRIGKATSDDLVIIAYSGPGFLCRNSLKDDCDLVTSDLLNDLNSISTSFIPETLFAESLRKIDAGTIVLIFDGGKFPKVSNTFDQIAANKKIQLIIADDNAFEYSQLGHGLLTYVLLEEGIKGGKVDLKSKSIAGGFQELSDFVRVRMPQFKRDLDRNVFIGKSPTGNR
jgi:hypothetical protein